MFYTFIIFAFGMYVGQEYTLLPSVRIMVERAVTYINEQNFQFQANQVQGDHQDPQTNLNDNFIFKFFRNIRRH